jgi:general secretion pathway protein D
VKTTAALLLGSLLAATAGAQTDTTIPAPTATNSLGNTPPQTVPIRRFPARGAAAQPVPAIPAAPATTIPVPGAAPAPSPTATPTLPSIPGSTPAAPAAGVVSPSAEADTAPAGEEVPSIRFSAEAAPLVQVLDKYFELVEKTPIYAGQTSPLNVNLDTTKILLKAPRPMTRKEAIVYLETTLGMNGITLVPIGEKFVKVVPDTGVAQAGGEFSKLKADQLPDSGAVIQQIVQLKYAAMEDVLQVIQPFAKTPNSIIQIPSTQTLVLRDYTENVKRMLEVIAKIDIISELEVKPEIIPIKYALAGDIANVLGTLSPSGSGTTVGQSTRTSGLGGSRSGAGGRGGGSSFGSRSGSTGGYGGGYGGGGIGGGVNTLQNSSSAINRGGGGLAGANNFQSNLRNIIQRAAGGGDFEILGNVKIIADERTNSLLIFASNTDMIMVKSIIEKLDVVLAQVLIESIIMEVSLNNTLDYGVSVYQPPKTTGNFTGGGGANNGGFFGALTNITSPPSGFGYTGTWGNDLEVAVKAAAGNGDINVLSRPRVQTSHAVPATLRIGEQYPFVSGTITDINGGARSQYQQTFIGIDLEILPLINPDGLVVMDITQDIQQRGDTVTIDGNPVPTTTQRAATAKVAVRDREIVALGGFIRNDRSSTVSGVPLLKDIPGLGALFRSTSKSNRRTEMMVLIKPTVLKTPEAASQAAMDMKDEMPSLKASTDRARADERKAARAAELETRRKLGLKD